MRKIALLFIGMCVFLISCVDKKKENKTTDLKQQIESVEEEINQDLKSLEKEAQEIENDLNELDKL